MIAPDSLGWPSGGTLADEINALHNQISALGKTMLEKAIRIGELLVAAKAAVSHGLWLKWLDKNVKFDRTTAFRYMRIFERRDELNVAGVQHLTDAYALLAKKTAHEPARAKGEQPAAAPSDSESKPSVAEPDTATNVAQGTGASKVENNVAATNVAPTGREVVEDEIPAEDDEKTIWRKGLRERAQKATSLAAYDDSWANYTFDAEVIDAAAQAADAWKELADYLRERSLPF
jgi:hypothetical protein